MRDVIVIGGGAGGLAVAIEAKKSGKDVLLIEKEDQLGGILNQCIHNGFGLEVFKEEYTGPEYAHHFIEAFFKEDIDFLLDTTVTDINKEMGVFTVKTSNYKDGMQVYQARAIALSTGSYERTSGQISIPGDRPYGVITAGSAQRYLNIDGYMVGKRVFILGSGDIGLIMARRMKLEGAEVLGVAELMPYSNGLTRNIVQCLNDFDIPLYLSHTVTDILSDKHHRLQSIVLSEVDQGFNPILGSEKIFDVDTLLLSIGLIPDITLLRDLGVEIDPLSKSAMIDQTYQTNIDGLFLCGNALQIHDLVDNVTIESGRTGKAINDYLNHPNNQREHLRVLAGQSIAYVTPQKVDVNSSIKDVLISFRSKQKMEKAILTIHQSDRVIFQKTLMFVVPAEMETVHLPLETIKGKDHVVVQLEVKQ